MRVDPHGVLRLLHLALERVQRADVEVVPELRAGTGLPGEGTRGFRRGTRRSGRLGDVNLGLRLVAHLHPVHQPSLQ